VNAVRVIKKYANRRLYDTETGAFINLGDIRKLVASGHSVTVEDVRSGENITRSILLQILVESEEEGHPLLSRVLLEQLIRFYGSTMQGFFSAYLEESVAAFQRRQDTIQKQMADLIRHGPVSAMTELVERNLDLWRELQSGFMGGKRRNKDDSGHK
jgi:polyhydroxyalkanoate synthesis repressor PhaR